MKNIRAAIVLYMSFAIRERGLFSENEVISALNISRSSFFRALSDFRCYLMEYRPWESVEFDSDKMNYYLLDESKKK